MEKKYVFLFPGQGAQVVGMAKDFYDEFSVSREVFEKANSLLGYSVSDLVFNGPSEKLCETKYCQIAIFVSSVAVLEALKCRVPGITPVATAGLSLGEYTALYAAGVITLEEGIKLTSLRGQYMQEASEKVASGLVAVMGLDESQVKESLKECSAKIWIANLNCPKQVVISGEKADLAIASEVLKAAGAKRTLPLDVSGAFHSGIMDSAKEKLSPVIIETDFKKPKCLLALNTTGLFTEVCDEIKNSLINQVNSTTYWEKSVREIEKLTPDLYLEIGPGTTLKGMNRKIGVSAQTVSLNKIGDFEQLDALAHSETS